MVARIFSYKIVHVDDFILSHLRLYLVFYRTFIYGFLHTWGLGGNLHFFRRAFFAVPSFAFIVRARPYVKTIKK